MTDNELVDGGVVVVDIDALQLATLGDGCPQGNIYDGSHLQPTRQGLRATNTLKETL